LDSCEQYLRAHFLEKGSYLVKQQQERKTASQAVEGATNDIPKTGFDAIETTDMLIAQNIYIERDKLILTL
jgi:hypothetical protein